MFSLRMVVNAGVEGDGVVEKTVFASNKTQTIMLPQFLKSPMSSFVPVTSLPSRTKVSGCRLDVGCSNCPDTLDPNMIIVNRAIVAEIHNWSLVTSIWQ